MTRQVFYDTDCLSSFLGINDCSILEFLFDEIIIPKGVYDEFMVDYTPSHITKNLKILIDKKFVKIEELDPFSPMYNLYSDICEEYEKRRAKPIGKGEAEAMSFAIFNNGVLASNNFNDIKYFVDKYELPLLTSAVMISISVDKGFISKEKASLLWSQMLKNDIRLPEDRFEEYYNGMYKSDYDDFGKRLNI